MDASLHISNPNRMATVCPSCRGGSGGGQRFGWFDGLTARFDALRCCGKVFWVGGCTGRPGFPSTEGDAFCDSCW